MTTTTTDKTKNPKQKRIMIASIIIAATIALGSTFAWFTSKDSVTNRLTASSDYGVSITETFTPPETWIPGQTINKDVSAVNTGNISAFVKLTLSNKLTLTYEVESDTLDTENAVTLDKDEANAAEAGGFLVAAYTINSNNTSTTNKIDNVTLGKITATDFTPEATGYYIFRREIEMTTNDGKTTSTYEYDGYYYVAPASGETTGTYYKITPTCNGTISYDSDDTVADSDSNGVADSASFTVKYAVKKTVENVEPTLTYEEAKYSSGSSFDYTSTAVHTDTNHPARIVARYDVDGNNSTDTSETDDDKDGILNKYEDDIVIYINLAENAVDGDKYWTYGGLNTDPTANTEAYFYLNKLLEAGKTSEKLVDSVELSCYVQSDAYKTLTYDLNIGLNSVQAVYEEDTGTTDNNDKTVDKTKSAESGKTLIESNATIAATSTEESAKKVSSVTVNDTTDNKTTVTWNTTDVTGG